MHNRYRLGNIVATALLAVCLVCGPGRAAFAQLQDIIDTLAVGSETARDPFGNTYTIETNSKTFTATTETITGFAIDQNGTVYNFTATQTLGGIETITGSINGGPFTCTFNTATGAYTGLCPFVALLSVTPGPSFAMTLSQGMQAGAQGVVRSQAGAVTTIISDRIRDISHDWAQGLALSGPNSSWRTPTGVAAGSADKRWGVWGDASGSFLSDSSSSLGYSGTSVVALAGIDFAFDRNWIFGFTSGYTHADIGLRAVPANRIVNGAVLGPYVSYIFNPNLTADIQMQYTALGNDLTVATPLLHHAFSGDRLTGAGNLNLFSDAVGWVKLTGFTGYSYTWEGSNAGFLMIPGLANNVHYGVMKVGGEATYPMGEWDAYVPLTLQYETTTPTDNTGRFGVLLGAGLRYRWSDAVKAGISFTSIEFKTHMQDFRVGGNLRVMF